MQQKPDFKKAALLATEGLSASDLDALIGDPVIVVSAPRSGSTLLFEQMRKLSPFWSIGGESHAIFREFPHLRAENAQLDSMALDEHHADPQTVDMMRRLFLLFARDAEGRRYFEHASEARPNAICLVEKTPRNAINIPFLLKVFPRARFVYLMRDPRGNISSLIEAWSAGLKTGGFMTFRQLPSWHLPGWCFLLPRGWREMAGKSVPEIATFQWAASNSAIMAELARLPRSRWHTLSYADFISAPDQVLSDLTEFAGERVKTEDIQTGQMALSYSTVSAPSPEKWKRHEKELTALEPIFAPIWNNMQVFR